MRRDQPILGVDLNALYGLHSFAFFFVVLGHRFGAHFFFMHLTNYRSVENVSTVEHVLLVKVITKHMTFKKIDVCDMKFFYHKDIFYKCPLAA